jgi:transposase
VSRDLLITSWFLVGAFDEGAFLEPCAGATQAQVAREFGVSPQSAHRWHARWKAGGTAGGSPRIGRGSSNAAEQGRWIVF